MDVLDEELPPIPSMLVQTFSLEAYLRSLSNKLSDKLNAVQSTLAGLQTEVKANTLSVNQVRQFLRRKTMKTLQKRLAGSSIRLPEGFSFESLLPDFLQEDSASSVEGSIMFASLSGLEAVQMATTSMDNPGGPADKMVKYGVGQPRKGGAGDVQGHLMSSETYEQLEKMCGEMEMWQKQHAGELERLATWFRPPSIGGDGNGNVDGDGCKDGGAACSMRDVLQSAPLFVEFRQLLLRDMMDRLGEAKDQQSMVLGNTIVALKAEMRREMHRGDGGDAGRGVLGDSNLGAGGGSATERRLRGLDLNYIQRSEIAALLREKANVSAVAQKADDVHVRDLERRLLDRFADMEERMSLYEEERKEFRRILRAVVDANQRSRSTIISDVKRDGDDAAARSTHAPANFVVVEETVDPRHARKSELFAADERPGARRTRPLSRSKQRADQTTSSALTKQAAQESQTQRHHQEHQQSSQVVEASPSPSRTTIGLTVNQEAYANYVTGEANRHTVEMLPPLPYERMRHQ